MRSLLFTLAILASGIVFAAVLQLEPADQVEKNEMNCYGEVYDLTVFKSGNIVVNEEVLIRKSDVSTAQTVLLAQAYASGSPLCITKNSAGNVTTVSLGQVSNALVVPPDGDNN